MLDVYHILGLMSGTSLDGLDMALCEFEHMDGAWEYRTLCCETVAYTDELVNQLQSVYSSTALELVKADAALANFMAEAVNAFVEKSTVRPDYIASHGQTIFHQPQLGFTTQIGSGAILASKTGIPVVCDFRSSDVALGGQGAPLVPIGDELLFGNYDACLNLGGFSNISYREDGRRIAFDISPCNMALNELAQLLNMPYDKDGACAAQGNLCESLLRELNSLPFYKIMGCKSLGREWYEQNFLPIVNGAKLSVQDKLRTVTEHIAMQLAEVINRVEGNSVLVTGGGARNRFLLQRLTTLCNKQIIVPDETTIDYKEAIIFAFLGLLRICGENNCLADVTGARHDHCGGCIYLP